MFVPTRPPTSFLYKYSSAEHLDWLKSILLEHELYFPNPSQLKDAKDARPTLASTSRQALTRFLVNEFLSRNRHKPMEVLALGVAQALSGVSTFGTDALLRELSKHFNLEMEKHRIYSLTTRPNNEHLWERYAEGHTGYCLEFRNEGMFALALQVQYVDTIELNVTERDQIDAVFLFQKTTDWRKEEEVRIVLFPRGRPASTPFEPHLLRRIILGRKMTEENRKSIRAWASLRSPELIVSDEDDARY